MKVTIIWATCVTAIVCIHGAVTVNKEPVVYNSVPPETPQIIIQPVENYVDNVDNFIEDEVIITPAYTEEQLEILAIIIYQEAGGRSRWTAG